MVELLRAIIDGCTRTVLRNHPMYIENPSFTIMDGFKVNPVKATGRIALDFSIGELEACDQYSSREVESILVRLLSAQQEISYFDTASARVDVHPNCFDEDLYVAIASVPGEHRRIRGIFQNLLTAYDTVAQVLTPNFDSHLLQQPPLTEFRQVLIDHHTYFSSN